MSPNEIEKSYLVSQITLLTQERASLPARFEQLKAQQEARIEAFLQEAGVLARVKEMRAEVEKLHRNVQSHSDVLGGKIEALQTVLDNFHRLKVPPGTSFDPISGEPLSPHVVPAHTPKVEAHDPEASGSEVYSDPEDDEEAYEEEAENEWDEEFAREVAGEGFDTEDDTDDDTANEGAEDDEIADAIENASDEAAVRALLARYSRKA